MDWKGLVHFLGPRATFELDFVLEKSEVGADYFLTP